jgi:predicted RNA-binding Zn ribbon-like protein
MERFVRETQKNRRISAEKSSSPPARREPELIGDHPAMDLLNTIVRAECGLVDVWQSDDDVLRWLVRMGLLKTNSTPRFRSGALLTAARGLRDVVRTLVVARKANKRLDLAALNDFLAKGKSHFELMRARDGSLVVVRRYDKTTPQGVLTPLAEAAAEFLATADFKLVRACEGVDCVLWFYDRTKAHRRRWCSMEICGNRNKIAKFRSRQQG